MEAKLREIIESIAEGVVYQKADGRIEFWNKAAEKIFRLTSAQAQTLTYANHDWGLIHEDGSPCPGQDHPSMVTLRTGRPLSNEIRGIPGPEGEVTWLSINTSPLFRPGEDLPYAVVISLSDIAKQKIAESAKDEMEAERETTTDLLRLINQGQDFREIMAAVTLKLQQWSGCEAVGIRLREGDDYPYYETRGFSGEFVQAETRLCTMDSKGNILRDEKGNPLLECMCGNIISGRFDPSFPFFTRGGSFWSNCTTELLASTSEAERQASTRNNCNGEGYESVALVPLRTADTTFGLLQLNDRRRGRFSPALIALVERLAQSLALGLAHRIAVSRLQESSARFQGLLRDIPSVAVQGYGPDGTTRYWNKASERLYGYTEQEALGRNLLDLIIPPEMVDEVEQAIKMMAGTGAPIPPAELSLMRKDGSRVEVYSSHAVVRSPGGEPDLFCLDIDLSERKRAEKKVDELATMVAFSRESIVGLDLRGFVTSWNQGAENLYGYGAAEAVGRHISFLVPEGHHDLGMEFLNKALAGEKVEQYETVRVTKDGRLLDLSITLSPLLNEFGQLTGVSGIARDITERKRAEEALRQSEATYKALVTGLPDIVMRFDREGRHLFASGNVREVVGLDPARFLGKTHRELGFPEDSCALWEGAIKGVFDSGQALESEFTFEGEKGLTIFNWRLLPERDAQGLVRSVLSISRDITGHRRAEESYRTLFRQMLDGFALHEIICDASGEPADYRFLAVNPAFERMTGLRAEDLVGRTVLEVMPGTERQWVQTYGKVALTGEPVFFENYSGELQKHFEVTAFRPASNQFACIFADITERKRAEEEKSGLEAQLRQAQKMEAIGTLAGGIAHDFNNILGAVLGFAEIAHEDAVAGRASPSDLKQIIASAQRAKELVKQILTFSRKNEPAVQPLSLNQACKKAQNILARTLPKMIAIESDLARNLPHILADPTQMEQVLLNLASNARDAMPEGGRFTLATRIFAADEHFRRLHPEMTPGDYVLLTVSDTGCGMDQDTREHIFEPFYTTKGTGQGTGLGLATVYGIVKSHGGFIYCASEPGRGAVFSIYLPVLSPAQPLDQPVAAKADEGATGGEETILLADDEHTLRSVASRLLRAVGYRVLETASGEEALATCASQPAPPDLVLMDLGMPGMGGHKAMVELLARHPGVKVVIASGYAADAQVKAALKDGAADYVAKPFKRAELLATVRRVLDGN